MQFINLNKVVEMESDILDLLLISIDDQIECIDEDDGVKVSGNIAVGGKVKINNEEKNFSDNIELNMFLTMDEISERSSLNVSVNDFSYTIENNKLYLNISLKIEGLKEIETSFLSQEDMEDISEEEVEKEEKKVYIDIDVNVSDRGASDFIEELNDEVLIEDISKIEDEKFVEKEINKKSLLSYIFSNKKIKEEISWKLHCVKKESTYKEIADKYGVDEKKLISLNDNEKIEEGKLIFIPLNKI